MFNWDLNLNWQVLPRIGFIVAVNCKLQLMVIAMFDIAISTVMLEVGCLEREITIL